MESLPILQQLIRQYACDGNTQTAIANMSLYCSRVTTGPMQAMYEPSLCVVVQGEKLATLGSSTFAYNSAHYLVVALDLPLTCSITAASEADPYFGLRVKLDVDVLRALILDMPPGLRQSCSISGLSLGTVTPDLLDPLVRLMRLLSQPEDIPVMAPLIEREILYRLMRGPDAEILHQLALADSRFSRVNKAIEWIKRNYREAFSVEAVAASANMSTSSFHHHFKAVTSMSPLQYQKHIRLHEARRLILSEWMEAARAGFEVGYGSPSQFSREYKRVFGAPPVREVSELRRMPAAERSAA